MRHRSAAVCLLATGTMLATVVGVASARAKTIKMPEGAPRVIFDVPDDWTVTATPLGVDIAPPDKSALIVSGLIKRQSPLPSLAS